MAAGFIINIAVAPNREFNAAVVALASLDDLRASNVLATVPREAGTESLFITTKDGAPLQEFSPTFRRQAGNRFPTYQVYWSPESSKAAGVAQFRRDGALAALQLNNQQWTKLELPQFDAPKDAHEAIHFDGNGTFDSEIVGAKWIEDGVGIEVDVVVSFKTPVVKQVDINYTFKRQGSEWVTTKNIVVDSD